MKQYIFPIVFILMCTPGISADDGIDYIDASIGYTHLYVSDNLIEYENIAGLAMRDYMFPQKIVLENYTTVKKSGLQFVTKNGKDYLLMLRNKDLVFLYSSDAIEHNVYTSLITGINNKIIDHIEVSSSTGRLESSSFLTEGKTKYTVSNLNTWTLNEPWVEGVPGYGVGEYIIIELKMNIGENPDGFANGMYFYNGYVSFKKSYLYESNSRVKQLLILDLNTGEQWPQDIKDTPNPQYIDLKKHEGHTLKLIINEVYLGSKWKDTCINEILLCHMH